MLQLAGMRLQSLREESAMRLAVDAFEKAQNLSRDRPVSHRLLAFSLLRARQESLAFEVIDRALRGLPPGPAHRILREDAALIAAAWVRAEPHRQNEIGGRIAALGMTFADRPEVSFALYWSGDVDVDLRLFDARSRGVALAAAGEGFEIAIVRGEPRSRAYPYRVEAHVYGRPPLGVTAGKLEIVEHDGKGGLWFVSRTFLLGEESGIVDLGSVAKPFGKGRRGP
jgi:hypothetical protein